MEETEKSTNHIRTAIIAAATAAVMITLLYLAAGRIFCGTPLWESKVVELGDSISDNAAEYITGPAWTIEHTKVDISGVNPKKVGNYTIKAKNLFATFDYQLKVRDTIPPVIMIGDISALVLATGQSYDTGLLKATAEDISGITHIRYKYAGEDITSLSFNKAGYHQVTVCATDINSNESSKVVSVLVDDPPVIFGLHEQYVLTGSTPEDLDPVFARDAKDGDLSDKIEYDTGDIDFGKSGDYTIRYSVSDSYHLETSAESVVHVVSAPAVVNSHSHEFELSTEEMAALIVNGHFEYEPLEEPDYTWVIENCDRPLVNLYLDGADAVSSGSAFIYDITPEYIYLMSVDHVTSALKGSDVQITFFDGTYINTGIKAIRLSDTNEASMFRIPVTLIPYHTLINLREVAYRSDIHDEIKPGDNLIEYCKNWRAGTKKNLIKDVTVISYELSKSMLQYVDPEDYYTATRESVAGMSGTAIFDERGYLAGICSKTLYPMSGEIPKYRNGCDLILKVDKLPMLRDRAVELDM